MSSASIIGLIFIAVFGGVIGLFTIVFVWRVVWAMRNPKEFEEFQYREAAARQARINKRNRAEIDRLAAGKPSWTGRFLGTGFTLAGAAIVVLSIRQIYERGLRFSDYQYGVGALICFGLGAGLLYVSRRRKPQKLNEGEISQ
jgi:hypothetical protein